MDSRSRAADLLPLVPAAAVPLLFLHRTYQAHATFGPVDVFGSDLAVAATVVAAVVAGIWWGFRPLLRPLPLWIVAGALLAVFFASCFWRPLDHTTRHLITAAKLAEYALLAPSLVLLFRRRLDVERFLLVFVGWSVAASAWGVLQFVGIANDFYGKRPGQREVSFLGIHDFGALSGAALAISFTCIVLTERRRLAAVAGTAGAVGAILAASVFAGLGIFLAAVTAVVVGRRAGTLTVRRGLTLAGILVVVGAGTLSLRSYDVTNFFSFLGVKATSASTEAGVQTSNQRTMLAYIGLRIWEDHPLLGVGLERSTTDYQPYLAAAKRKYPQSPSAYPSPTNLLGVQNLWVELLADVGVVGFALGVATFAIGLVLALRVPRSLLFFGLVAAGWILVAAGTWNSTGIIAGLPLDAVTWLGLGLAAVVSQTDFEVA